MKHALPAVALTALVLGCTGSEPSETPRPPLDAAVATNLAHRFDSLATPDTAIYRAVARIDSVPHSGLPGDARSLVTFADSTTLEVPIRGAELLGELPVPGRASWLLLSGTECSECDANVTVWVFRATPGRIERVQLGFAFPGEMIEAGIESLPYFRSRLFLGQCLEDANDAAVWLEEVLQPDSARTRRVRVLVATPTLSDRVLPWTEDTESRLLARVAAGRCREVPPQEQYVA
jgi:hypothetical protein